MNPKSVSLLSPMIITKKLYPFLAMNPKAVSLLSPLINQEANPLLAMNQKVVSPLSPVFKKHILFLAMNPKTVNLLSLVIARRPSLENSHQELVSWKPFCKNEGEKENRIEEHKFLSLELSLTKKMFEQKLRERCWKWLNELVLISSFF